MFAGRKIGILGQMVLTDALTKAASDEGATVEIIAHTVGGIKASDGSQVKGHEKVGGGQSVLYDAVAILPSKAGVERLAMNPAARDFAADAFAHLKFIAYNDAASTLFDKAGLPTELDGGCFQLSKGEDATRFIKACRALRLWDREKLFNG